MRGIILAVIVFIVAIIVIVMSWTFFIPLWWHKETLRWLAEFECDPTLYYRIKQAKKYCFVSKKDNKSVKPEPIRVEVSQKAHVADTKKVPSRSRYIIPILLQEFIHYREADIKSILDAVSVSFDVYETILADPRIGKNTDIIFGMDQNKGKLYLDFGGILMESVCYESDGTRKDYLEATVPPEDTTKSIQKHTIHVFKNGQPYGVHYNLTKPLEYRCASGTGKIHWIAELTTTSMNGNMIENWRTIYIRPDIFLL